MTFCDPSKIVILGPPGPVGPQGLQGPAGTSSDLPGFIRDFAGPVGSIPAGYLLCDGTSYLTASYPNLFTAIGYYWGGSAGSFKVPNLIGRVTVGLDTMSVNISGAVTVGNLGGEAFHQLTIPEIPSHRHAYHGQDSGPGGGLGIAFFSGNTGYTDNTGNDQAHNNVQPFATVVKVIKY